MYRGWKVKRWDTPVSDINDLAMVSLLDRARRLDMIVQSLRDPSRRRWRMRFEDYSAYRNTDELYFVDLWRWLDESDQRCGSTFIFEASSWNDTNSGLPHMDTQARHYVVATIDDVLEVVSGREPVWEEIAPAKPDSSPPGKADHLFLPDDREEVELFIKDIQARQPVAQRHHKVLDWFKRIL